LITYEKMKIDYPEWFDEYDLTLEAIELVKKKERAEAIELVKKKERAAG